MNEETITYRHYSSEIEIAESLWMDHFYDGQVDERGLRWTGVEEIDVTGKDRFTAPNRSCPLTSPGSYRVTSYPQGAQPWPRRRVKAETAKPAPREVASPTSRPSSQ